MARRTHVIYEYRNPRIGKGPEPDSGYNGHQAAKEIYEFAAEGWEFLQVYTVTEPCNDYMGKVMRSMVYALFRREKE